MRLTRENRNEKHPLRSMDALGITQQEQAGNPSELLAPEVRRKILEIKRGYEGGMMGDRIPPYTSFLAAARRCWPELADELQIADRFTTEASAQVSAVIPALLRGNDAGRQQTYFEAIHYLYKIAFIHPALLQAEVPKNKTRLFELLDEELEGTKYAYMLRLASVLWLGAPETQSRVADKLRAKSVEISSFVTKHKTWLIGGLAKLFLPEVSIEISNDDRERYTAENQRELFNLVQLRNYGETSRLDGRLDAIFGLGILLANQATLQPDGTVHYTYAKEPEQQRPLPDRPLT